MAVCGVSSLGDFEGGATYFARGEPQSSNGAHQCALEAGHSGPHAKRTLLPLSPEAALQTTYLWSDENELTALVAVVPLAITTGARRGET